MTVIAVMSLLETEEGRPGRAPLDLGEGLNSGSDRLSACRRGALGGVAGRRLNRLLEPAQGPGSGPGAAVRELERTIGHISNGVLALGLALDEPEAILRSPSGGVLDGRHFDHSLVGSDATRHYNAN